MKKKPVLILENKDFIVEKSTYDEKNNTYELGGIFAEFSGKKNNNGRIYEAKEYLPHLEYLNKKINENRLFGELDHPEKFDVSMSKVSHMITSLTYIKEENVIRGKIKIFDTTMGKDAQAIIRGGGTLSISSRAAGVVNENNSKVKIKRIFTYDLVGDPGFSSAKLTKINESLGIDDENLGVYEVSDSFINEVKDPAVKYELNEMMKELNGEDYELINEVNDNSKKPDKLNKQNDTDMNEKSKNRELNEKEYVKTKHLSEYSKVIQKNILKLQKKVEMLENNNSNINENSLNEIKEEIGKVINYSNYMAENHNSQESKIDDLIKYVNYLAETQETHIQFSNYLAEEFGNDVTDIKESQKNQIQFVDYLGSKLNETINHSDYIVEGLNTLTEFADYLAENQNKTIEHNDYLVETIQKVIEFSDYLAENVDDSIDHGDYLATIIDKGIQHSDHIAEKVQNLIYYAEYVANNSLPNLPNDNGLNENLQVNGNSINENQSLPSKIAAFNDLVQKQKISSNVESRIQGLLSEANAYKLENLNSTEKQKVVSAILENQCKSEEEVLKVWEQALETPEKRRRKTLLNNMPKSVKSSWDSLNERQQERVFEQSKHWSFRNSTQIKDFWFRQDFTNEKDDVQKIQESLSNNEMYKEINESRKKSINSLGYDVNAIANQFGLNPKKDA